MSATPGLTADLPQAQPQIATEPQLGSERSSGALSLKDKLQLNRKAKAHGLPALWPEVEMYNTWTEQMRLSGLQGFIPYRSVDALLAAQGIQFPFGSLGLGAGIANHLSPYRQMATPAIWHGPCPAQTDIDEALSELLRYDDGSLLGDVRDALRSLFFRFRGPLPW